MKTLTILIPCFNEELSIQETIEELMPFCVEHNWEIIVIDDGSTDKTSEVLNYINNIKVLKHIRNKGYGASLKTGISNTNTDFLAFYDADGQHRPEDLLSLFLKMKDFDMLVGQRGKDSHQEWIRKPGKWILSKVADFLAETKIPDLNSGLRIVRKDVIIRMLHLFPQGFSFSTTTTIAFLKMGFNVSYFPIIVNKRIGKSTVKQLKHGPETLLLILRLIVLFNPLRIFLPISFLFFVIGFIYEIIYGIFVLYPDVKLIPAAFFMILTSVLVSFFGLIADQISALRLDNIYKMK